MSTEFLLKWHNHKMDIVSVFDELLSKEALVDVTLACEDFSLKAHKMVLSACSPFFQKLFLETPCKHPVVFLKDVSYSDLKAVVEFMYKGEAMVPQQQMGTFLRTARSLKVIGLTTTLDEQRNENNDQKSVTQPPLHAEATTQEKLANSKRKSLHDVKSESVTRQSLVKGSSDAVINESSQDHDQPLYKRRLLETSSTLSLLKSSPQASSPSHISSNQNIVKLAVENKVVSELTSNEQQEPTPENSLSDCSQQSSKTETASLTGICSDDTVHKKSEGALLLSPDVQSTASCSSNASCSLEKNSAFSTQNEIIKEPPCEISHTDGKIAKVLKKLPKPHNKSVADHEPIVIYENINTGENAFICDECGRMFPHSGFLRLHKRIHSGERPWACEICNESFTQFTYLLQHQKSACPIVSKEQINSKAQQFSDSSPDVT